MTSNIPPRLRWSTTREGACARVGDATPTAVDVKCGERFWHVAWAVLSPYEPHFYVMDSKVYGSIGQQHTLVAVHAGHPDTRWCGHLRQPIPMISLLLGPVDQAARRPEPSTIACVGGRTVPLNPSMLSRSTTSLLTALLNPRRATSKRSSALRVLQTAVGRKMMSGLRGGTRTTCSANGCRPFRRRIAKDGRCAYQWRNGDILSQEKCVRGGVWEQNALWPLSYYTSQSGELASWLVNHNQAAQCVHAHAPPAPFAARKRARDELPKRPATAP